MRRAQVILFVLALVVVRWGTSPASAASGPVALWHMNETSGSVMNDAVGDHDGALQSVQLGQPGVSGTAYGFRGSAKVTVPSSSGLNPGSEDFAVTLSMRATDTPSVPDWDLIRKGTESSTGGDWKMEYQPTGQASCGFLGSSRGAELIAGPALNDGRWHVIRCVKTSSAIQVIVDGMIYSKWVSVGSITNSAPIILASHGSVEFFQGYLDEASIDLGPQTAPSSR